MRQSAMHEHGSKQSKKYGNIGNTEAGHFKCFPIIRVYRHLGVSNNIAAGEYFGRNGRIGKRKVITLPKPLPVNIYKNIKRYKQIINDRERFSVPVIITYGEYHLFF